MYITQQFSSVPFTTIKEQLASIAVPFLDYFFKTENARITDAMKKNAVFPASFWRNYVQHQAKLTTDADHITDLFNHAFSEGLYTPLSVREAGELLGVNARNAGSFVRVRPEHLQTYARIVTEKLPPALAPAPQPLGTNTNAIVGDKAGFNAAPVHSSIATAVQDASGDAANGSGTGSLRVKVA